MSGSDSTSEPVNKNYGAKLGQTAPGYQNATVSDKDIESAIPKPLQFFNYHEYVINDYSDISSFDNQIDSSISEYPTKYHDIPIVITHFPNVHVQLGSLLYKETRIVRIPRIFSMTEADIYPQFSTYLPGGEPGAFTSESQGPISSGFYAKGKYMGNFFGFDSMSPLSNYVTKSEYSEIAENVNIHLKNSFTPFSIFNVMESILEVLSFQLYGKLKKSHSKNVLVDLDNYIDGLNGSLLAPRGVELIHPRRSGYLSVSI